MSCPFLFKSQRLYPGPPTRMYKGPLAHSHFLGKGGIFGRLSRENFPETNGQKGGVLKPISRDMGVFQKLPEKLRKRGYDSYVHVSRAFNSLPRKGDRTLISLHFYGRDPQG